MITPEMYDNAMQEIWRLRDELRQCHEIGNNLIVENAKLRSELDQRQSGARITGFRWKGDGYVPIIEEKTR